MPKLGAFSEFDYSQIEPRLTAYYAQLIGFPEFAEQIRNGVDSYTAVAKLVTGKDEVTDLERQTWKRAYLSLLYGGGVKTIQLQFGNSQAEARKMIKTFHANWPAVTELQEMTKRAHARKGYIVSIGGRRLHMEPYGEHKLLNKLIQGSAADIIKDALIRIHGWLRTPAGERTGLTYDTPVPADIALGPRLQSHMVNVIHDSAMFDGPVDELGVLHDVIPRLMVDERVNEIVPILVDHEVSTATWADKIPYEDWRTLPDIHSREQSAAVAAQR